MVPEFLGHSNKNREARFFTPVSGVFLVLLFLVQSVSPLSGKLVKMTSEEMSQVTGRTNLLNFTVQDGNTNYSGSIDSDCGVFDPCETTNFNIDNTDLTFVRLKANARITGEAIDDNNPAMGIRTLKLAHYDNSNQHDGGGYVTSSECGDINSGDSFYGPCVVSGHGWLRQNNHYGSPTDTWDNDLADMDIGTNGGVPIVMKGPYVEMAFRNHGTSNREMVGLRMGATAARGTVVLNMTDNYVTGSIASHGNVLGIDQNMIAAGHRWDESTLGINKIQFLEALELGQNSGSPEGNNNGWTEDFWISLNKEDIFYEFQNAAYDVGQGGSPPSECSEGCGDDAYMMQGTDGQGFWMHLRDDANADASLF